MMFKSYFLRLHLRTNEKTLRRCRCRSKFECTFCLVHREAIRVFFYRISDLGRESLDVGGRCSEASGEALNTHAAAAAEY